MADIETPRWRDKIKVGAIMSRVQKHAAGEIEMSATQIRAAEIYLRKTVPDLSSMQHTGDKDKPIVHTVKWGD